MKKLCIAALLLAGIANLQAKPLDDTVNLNTYGYPAVVTNMYEAWQQEGREIPAILEMCYNNIKEGNFQISRGQLRVLHEVVGPYASCYAVR